MNDLVEFAKRVKGELMNANREPHWDRDQAERYMAEVELRRRRFNERASFLSTAIIQPRLEILSGYFSNASRSKDEHDFHYTYWFGFTERFPVSTNIAVGVEHDVRFEKIVVAYSAAMVPQFIKLNERDRLTLPLEDAPEEVVAKWIEDRLLEFLDGYLRLDRGGEDFTDESVTDPVCGMRITRSSAAASDSFRGHPYFFCCQDCQVRFERDPQIYVEAKLM